MADLPAGISSGANGRYRRHRPELTLLYQIVEQHYPEFKALLRAQDRELPAFVQREFAEYLKCGMLEHGFLRVRCNDCHAEKLVAFSWPLLRIHAPAAFVHPCTAKTPWRDGTTHVLFEPLDFISRLAALVPRPRVNLTRYHGMFAPNSRWRSRITPSSACMDAGGRATQEAKAERGKRRIEDKPLPAAEKPGAMTWARRLKRVFSIDIEVCEQCGGAVKISHSRHPASRDISASTYREVGNANGL